jgi:hypothetical protein
MPRVEFELMILAFERAKTVHASDRAATVISKDDHIKDDKATGACSTHYNFLKPLVINLKRRDPVRYICVGGRMILKCILII